MELLNWLPLYKATWNFCLAVRSSYDEPSYWPPLYKSKPKLESLHKRIWTLKYSQLIYRRSLYLLNMSPGKNFAVLAKISFKNSPLLYNVHIIFASNRIDEKFLFNLGRPIIQLIWATPTLSRMTPKKFLPLRTWR